MMKYTCLLLLLLHPLLYAQEVDELNSLLDQDLESDEALEFLLQLQQQKIDLNKVSRQQLEMLQLLSPTQTEQFISYRNSVGRLFSVYELQAIPSFDTTVCRHLAAVSFVSDPNDGINVGLLKRLIHEKNNYLLFQYQLPSRKKAGFIDNDSARRFQGNLGKTLLRFRVSHPGEFSIGFTAEQDEGEQWKLNGRQAGFDYWSGHVQMEDHGRLTNLVIGDYQAQFGQGLAIGGLFGLGKSSVTVSGIRKPNVGFVPYTSVYESGALRGFAVSYRVGKNTELNAFISNARRDAVIHTDSSGREYVTSLIANGTHRTQREMASRKRILEQQGGIVLTYKKQNLECGMLTNAVGYSTPFKPDPSPVYARTKGGNYFYQVGAFVNLDLDNNSVFGEVTFQSGAASMLVGILTSLTPRLDASFMYRSYSPRYRPLNSNALSENSLPANEQGFYWGIHHQWNKRVSASGYIDLFRFPWLRYSGASPSPGHELLAALTYQPDKQTKVVVQLREEKKDRNQPQKSGQSTTQTWAAIRRNIQLKINYPASQHMHFQTTLLGSEFLRQGHSEHGSMIAQDLNFYITSQLKVTGRYALFDTDSWDTRLYAYERNVWLAYSIPAFGGTGTHWMVMLECDLPHRITLWARLATTRYDDRTEIGSGADKLVGNVIRDIKFQVRIKL